MIKIFVFRVAEIKQLPLFPPRKTPSSLTGSITDFENRMQEECGGWGVVVKNEIHYDKIKETCYLTIRNGVLCCISKPDCPQGMIAETPIKPYHVFPLKSIQIGCVKETEIIEPKSNQELCILKKKKSYRFYLRWTFIFVSVLAFPLAYVVVAIFLKRRHVHSETLKTV